MSMWHTYILIPMVLKLELALLYPQLLNNLLADSAYPLILDRVPHLSRVIVTDLMND